MRRAFRWTVLVFFAAGLTYGGAQISRQPAQKAPLFRPDLVVTGIDFQKVQSGTDAQGKTYWIFNVTAKIKNQGNGNAGAFKVLLERNNGAGGAWQTACQTCTIDVAGLAAGQEMTTAPRQFNNAMGMPSKFKFTADSGGQVGESNEGNNSREEAFVSMQISEIPGGVNPGGGTVPILKCDLALLSWNFKDVTSAVVDGKTIFTFKIEATIKNLGPGASPTAPLRYQKCDNTKVCLYDYNTDIPPLVPGEQIVIVTNPVTYQVGNPMNYCYVRIDPNDVVPETNEYNNSVDGYKKIPGTMN